MSVGDTFDFYSYQSSDGSAYAVKLSAVVAAAGGFTSIVNPRTVGPFPYGARNLRHIYGLNSTTGSRVRIPIHDEGNSLYQNGGTFSFRGHSYEVEGAFGEKQSLSSI